MTAVDVLSFLALAVGEAMAVAACRSGHPGGAHRPRNLHKMTLEWRRK